MGADMDLRQLRTFREIAEAGSLSRAADRLRIAQPALSRQIRLLEAEAGLPLFTRHGRGMALTDAGREPLGGGLDLVELPDPRQSGVREHPRGGARLKELPPDVGPARDLGHVRARINAADARAEAALANYEQTVLTTLEETENALVDFGRERVRQDFLRESVQASETAAKLARQRFEAGATDFLTVLDAERVMLDASDQLARSQTRTATSLVAVYKALGGGWETLATDEQQASRQP